MSRLHKPNECVTTQHTYVMNHIVVEPIIKCIKKAEPDQKSMEESINECYALAEAKANQMIKEARKQADAMLAEAKQEANLLMEQASQQAYDEGFEQGKIEGLQQFDEAVKEVQTIVTEMVQQKETMVLELEPQIVRLSIAIAEKIIHQQIVLDDQRFLAIIMHAIKKAATTEKLEITVCPEQYPQIVAWKNMILSQVKQLKAIDINEDAFLQMNDCFINTNAGLIDASVTTQILKIEQVFDVEKPCAS